MRVIVACGNGMGSSLMMKLTVEKIFRKAGVDADIDHSSVGDACGIADNYDLVLCPMTFCDMFAKTKAKVIGVQNAVSSAEITEKLQAEGII